MDLQNNFLKKEKSKDQLCVHATEFTNLTEFTPKYPGRKEITFLICLEF